MRTVYCQHRRAFNSNICVHKVLASQKLAFMINIAEQQLSHYVYRDAAYFLSV